MPKVVRSQKRRMFTHLEWCFWSLSLGVNHWILTGLKDSNALLNGYMSFHRAFIFVLELSVSPMLYPPVNFTLTQCLTGTSLTGSICRWWTGWSTDGRQLCGEWGLLYVARRISMYTSGSSGKAPHVTGNCFLFSFVLHSHIPCVKNNSEEAHTLLLSHFLCPPCSF